MRYITLFNDSFRYDFDKHTGLFCDITYKNQNYLTAPMEWNIYRAPTDNDRNIKEKWIDSGYDRHTVKVYSAGVETLPDGSAKITAVLGLAAIYIERFIDISVTWTVDCSGKIYSDMQVKRNTEFPFLPRFGLRMMMPKKFCGVEYYGYGPYESYNDKHQASYLGKFANFVSEMHEDYIKPQENGSHYGCRNITISDGAYAMSVDTCGKPLCFNASEYTQEELAAKAHNYELEKSGNTVFCLDYKQSGVGSNSCGPELLQQYRLEEAEFEFKFVLYPHC